MPFPRKLIEVALPLEAINKASAREKSIRHGHPSTLHLWWARRPLAAARAVIFAQMVDDPSSRPDLFPTEAKQEKERKRLFKIIEELVQWENTTNEEVLQRARNEIWESWRRTCAENADHPRAKELFDRNKLPAFHDPFAGGGSLPLEAQRLGLESYASDLNPVAVLINKAMIEIPPKFAGRPPVNPESRATAHGKTWKGAQGLAEDVRYYGKWMRDEAEKRIGHLYPKVEITAEMVKERPDLKPYLGKKLTVIAWIWARTVKSPNPAFSNVDVPLASTFFLSTKKGKEAYIEPVIEKNGYYFKIKIGIPINQIAAQNGTKLGGSGSSFFCLMSGTPMTFEYLRREAKAGGMGTRLMAIVAEGDNGRIYLSPSKEMEEIAHSAIPSNVPDTDLPKQALGFRIQEYGMLKWKNLFSQRQLVALTTLSDMIQVVREKIKMDTIASGWLDDGKGLDNNGINVSAYCDALSVYLGLSVSRTTNTINMLTVWSQSREQSVNLFSRQAIPMGWDFPEVNPFGGAAGDFGATTSSVAKTISISLDLPAFVLQADAQTQNISEAKVISTDPPYYDNIGYADLSDFFYVWLRRSIYNVYPTIFSTLSVPKTEELIATPFRHESKEKAEKYFLVGMSKAMHRLVQFAHPVFPVTIYYAFKQSESDNETGTASTGWDTFLAAVIDSGFAITGTLPMRTERNSGVKSGTNILASSIILVCRRRDEHAGTITRREFQIALKNELPGALKNLQRGNIAPVDLAQAAIGPGMAVFTRYAKVLDIEGQPVTVRDALAMINQTLDEVLAEQEGDFDADTRWALAWFEQNGFDTGEYGVAETLSKAKNTSVGGMVEAKIVKSKSGKVQLLRPDELNPHWDPATDVRPTAWEILHQFIRALESGGETGAAELVAKTGAAKSEEARELCYRLYVMCERKKRAKEAGSYNGLVQSWQEILKLAAGIARNIPVQSAMFETE